MKSSLQSALKDALRARDQSKLDTIRAVLAAMQYEEMQRNVEELPDTVNVEIIQREIKKRKEEIEFAEKANRTDVKEKALVEVKVLEAFLPQQISAPELEKIITELKSSDAGASMGSVMKVLKEKYAGQYDARAASEIAKRICG